MSKKFLKVCGVNDLEEGKGFRFVVDDMTDIALFKIKEKIFAVDNICPHNHTPKMHLGYLEGEHVLCPVHFYKFSLLTGKPDGDFGGNLKTYEVKIEDGDVYVEKPDNKYFDFEF